MWLERIFSYKGRYGRRDYISAFFCIGLIHAGLVVCIFLIGLPLSMKLNSKILGDVVFGVAIMVNVIGLTIQILQQIKRLHDLDSSGWWSAASIIPLGGLILLVVLCCSKGTAGQNRFGPDPLANPHPKENAAP